MDALGLGFGFGQDVGDFEARVLTGIKFDISFCSSIFSSVRAPVCT